MRRLALIVLVAALAAATMLAGCTSDIPEPTGVPAKTRSAYLYFATGRSLVEESRVIDASDPYAAILREWLKATPEINADIAIVQPEAEIRSVTLKDGVATVDWSRAVLKFEAEPQEKLIALGGILRTLGQFPEVKKVAFTVEGKTTGTIDGKDIQAFWGDVSLKGQPWDAARPQPPASQSTTATK